MPLADFGTLGLKSDQAAELLGRFQRIPLLQEFAIATVNATPRVMFQQILPPDDNGFYAFELNVSAINRTSGALIGCFTGRFVAAVNAVGVVTLPADADVTLVDLASAAAVTNVTVTLQSFAAGVRPAAVNINAVGIAAADCLFVGNVRTLSYITRLTQVPLSQPITVTSPALL